jgi:hypothetical protein
VEIAPSARRHGVTDDDMVYAVRHHMTAFATNDTAVLMLIGPSRRGALLEVGVVIDMEGVAIIHAMPARRKFLSGMEGS